MRYYGPLLRESWLVLYEAGKQHNEMRDWVILVAGILVLLFPALGTAASKWAPTMTPVTDLWPWGSGLLFLGLALYALGQVTHRREAALEARVAEGERETAMLRARLTPKLTILREHRWPYIQVDPGYERSIFHRLGIRNDSGTTVRGVTLKVEACRPLNMIRPGTPFRIMDAPLEDVVQGIEIAAGDTKYAEIVRAFEADGRLHAIPHFARATTDDRRLGEGIYQLTVIVTGDPTNAAYRDLTLTVPHDPHQPVTLELARTSESSAVTDR